MAKEFGLEPYSDRIILKQVKIEQKTASGIIIAEQQDAVENYHGEVIAVGEGKRLDSGEAIPVKSNVGDIVAFNPRVGIPIKHEGEEYLLIRESEIYYKIK